MLGLTQFATEVSTLTGRVWEADSRYASWWRLLTGIFGRDGGAQSAMGAAARTLDRRLPWERLDNTIP